MPDRHRGDERAEHRRGVHRRVHDRHCLCKVHETHPPSQDGPLQQECPGHYEERGLLPALQVLRSPKNQWSLRWFQGLNYLCQLSWRFASCVGWN